MQAVNFEQARIFWTTKSGIDGIWRVIATARQQRSPDGIFLAPAVMAGKILGAERLPLDLPYSFQLIARRARHHRRLAVARVDQPLFELRLFVDCHRRLIPLRR
jgi:hypothetical protein